MDQSLSNEGGAVDLLVKNTNQISPALAELLLEIIRQASQKPQKIKLEIEIGKTHELIMTAQIDRYRYILLRSENHLKAIDSQVSLSPREQEIVRLITKGMPNKMIGAILDISPWTVNTHIRRIFGKLNVSTRTEMVAVAIKLGLLNKPKKID